jgi:hypothetical protein
MQARAHFTQADFWGLVPLRKQDSFRLADQPGCTYSAITSQRLFVTQRDYRVDSCGPTGRLPTGDEGNPGQGSRSSEKSERVKGPDAKE